MSGKRQSRRIALLLFFVLVAAFLAGGRWLSLWQYPWPYRELVRAEALQSGLSPHLVAAVIRAESRWRPRATSPRGARGLMQVMPDTGRWIAEQLKVGDFHPDQLYDPAVNIRFGTWYLAYLRREFDGDIVLALAAYNGGKQNVSRWLQENRWTGGHYTLYQIPFKETREFVTRVMAGERRYQRLYRQ